MQELRQRLAAVQAPDRQLAALREEAAVLRGELALRAQQVTALERDLAAATARLQNVAAAASGQPPPVPLEQALPGAVAPALAQPVPPAVAAPPPAVSLGVPVGSVAAAAVQLMPPQPTAQLASAALPIRSAGTVAAAQQLPQQPVQAALGAAPLPAAQHQHQHQQAAALLQPQAPAMVRADTAASLAPPVRPQPQNGALPGAAQQLAVSVFQPSGRAVAHPRAWHTWA